MSRVKAFSQNSLFLQQFWREFRISFWCHKPLSKTKRLENDTFELLTTFSFYSSCLILLIMRSWTGRSSHVRGKKNFKMHLKIPKLSTEARLPTPRYGQYLKHAYNSVHECHYQGDMVVRMLKVLAILGSWYVCFSAEIRFEIPWNFLTVNINLHFCRLEVKNNLFWPLISFQLFDRWLSKLYQVTV